MTVRLESAANPWVLSLVDIPHWRFAAFWEPLVDSAELVKSQNSVLASGQMGRSVFSFTVAAHGIVFAPGKAGTLQEIFQDAVHNYYRAQTDRFSPIAPSFRLF